ncbi:MAG: hypothetical protein K9H16_05870 [Bacteroidales bacterium]|nr:hypothetical protein [Bacteroidales bacterium]
MSNDKLRNACAEASEAIEKLNEVKFADLKEKLDFCIGSYDFDKNPTGLYEYGEKAFKDLTAYKVKNPKKVNKKVLAALEKALAE